MADLPCGGQSLRLLIQVRKYFCEESTCPRKIFAERLVPFVEPLARVTKRLCQMVQVIGLATGGRLGKRVTDRIGIQTSRQTILRRIMALPTKPVGSVPQIGIDDFAFRRGRKFGTIIVDLRTHRVIDVLADRTAETATAWMAAHPEPQLVSRDRGGDYAAAARKGAPQATQTTDRFHLYKNLGEALEEMLARHLAVHRRHGTEQYEATPLEGEPSKQPPKQSPKEANRSQAKREERLAQYQQIVTLRQLGLSQAAIAAQVGIDRSTISRWLQYGTFPKQQPRPRSIDESQEISEACSQLSYNFVVELDDGFLVYEVQLRETTRDGVCKAKSSILFWSLDSLQLFHTPVSTVLLDRGDRTCYD